MYGTVRQPDGLDSVSERARGDDDARPLYRGQATCPVAVPHRRPVRARDAGVEPDTVIDPAAIRAHGLGEAARIVVGMVVVERVFRVAVEILPVDERNGALDVRFAKHGGKK